MQELTFVELEDEVFSFSSIYMFQAQKFSGWDVKEAVYRKLGDAEVVDTLDMIRAFINTFGFIDEDRIAVMGWVSYVKNKNKMNV